MRAGFLRHRLELIGDDVPARDSFGQVHAAPAVLGTFWAGVRPSRQDEAVDGPQVRAATRHVVALRWQGPSLSIRPRMRLRFAGTGRVLQILSVVQVDERRAAYELTCEESD